MVCGSACFGSLKERQQKKHAGLRVKPLKKRVHEAKLNAFALRLKSNEKIPAEKELPKPVDIHGFEAWSV
jgi:hypothetical protein